MLGEHIEALVADLLPNGHREGHEYRVGSVAGEAGCSLGIHLGGLKRGIWSDFAAGIGGDALDLVREVLGLATIELLAWSRRWLEGGEATIPRRPRVPKQAELAPNPDRWLRPWGNAVPIAGTLAERYLAARGLRFEDRDGRVLRFATRRARKNPANELEQHPALLAALSDARTGEQVGVINIYLLPDGRDRLRDNKGKTVTGRAKGAVVMLSAFDEPTAGLTICEGAETGISLLNDGQAPVWACGAAGMMAQFPVLGGIECLTVAADTGEPGQRAAATVAAGWREAGDEAVIITPAAGDWAGA